MPRSEKMVVLDNLLQKLISGPVTYAKHITEFNFKSLYNAYSTLGARGVFCFVATVSGEAAIVNKRKKPLVTAGMNLTSMLIRDKTVCQTGFMWDLFVFVI